MLPFERLAATPHPGNYARVVSVAGVVHIDKIVASNDAALLSTSYQQDGRGGGVAGRLSAEIRGGEKMLAARHQQNTMKANPHGCYLHNN